MTNVESDSTIATTTLAEPPAFPAHRDSEATPFSSCAGVELLDHLFLLGVTTLATGAIDRQRRTEVLAALRILAGATSELARERLLRVSNLAIVAAAGMKFEDFAAERDASPEEVTYAERIASSPEVRRLRQILDDAAAA